MSCGAKGIRPNRHGQAFRDSGDFAAAACDFDAVVFATFPEHHIEALDALLRRRCAGQRIVVVVHNPSELIAGAQLLQAFASPKYNNSAFIYF